MQDAGNNGKPLIALIEKSLDGRITRWDEGAVKMFGYPPDEAIGKHISIIIPFDYQDEEYELLDRLKAEDFLEVRRTLRRSKDGKFFEVMLSASPIRDAEGKIVGALKKVQYALPDESRVVVDGQVIQTPAGK